MNCICRHVIVSQKMFILTFIKLLLIIRSTQYFGVHVPHAIHSSTNTHTLSLICLEFNWCLVLFLRPLSITLLLDTFMLWGDHSTLYFAFIYFIFFEKLYLFQLVTQDIMYFEENAMVFFLLLLSTEHLIINLVWCCLI